MSASRWLALWLIFQLLLPPRLLAETVAAPSSPPTVESRMSLPGPVDLDLSSQTRALPAGQYLGAGPVDIQVGGGHRAVSSTDLITPAELMAAMQVAQTGRQDLVVDAGGRAVGGNLMLGAQLSQMISGLVVPGGVSIVRDFAAAGALNLPGNLVNFGTIYGVSTGAGAGQEAVSQAVFGALNIQNGANALITTVVPAGGIAGLTGLTSNLNLSLSAVNQLINLGTIASAGNLNIAAAAIVNSGTITGAGNVAMSALSQIQNLAGGQIVAQQALNVNTATLVNSGLLSSLSSSLNVLDSAGTLSLINTHGTLSALEGALRLAGAGGLTATGGTLRGSRVDLSAPGAAVLVDADIVEGPVSAAACTVTINVRAGTLALDALDVTGDPLISNSNGDVLLNSAIDTGSGPLSVFASGSIFGATGAGTTIRTSGAPVLLLAGAAQSTAGGTTTVLGASGQTGNISRITLIDSSSTSGGAVTLGTFDGTISVGDINAGGSTGTAGAVRIYAPGQITVGAITATGDHGAAAAVNVVNARAVVGSGGLTADAQGGVTAGSVSAGAAGQGGVTTGAINTSSSFSRGGDVVIGAAGNLVTGLITTQAGTPAASSSNGAAGGAVNISSTAGYINVTGAVNASGGNGRAGGWAISAPGGNGGNGGSVIATAGGALYMLNITSMGGGGGGGGGSGVTGVDAGKGGDGGNGGAVTLSSGGSVTVGAVQTNGGNGGGGGGACCEGGVGGDGGTGGPNGQYGGGAMGRGPLIGSFPWGTLPGGWYYGPVTEQPGGGYWGGGGAPGGWWGGERGGEGGTGGSGGTVTITAQSSISTGAVSTFGGGSGGGGGMAASGGGGASGAYGGRGEDMIVVGDGVPGGAPSKYAGGGGGGYHYYPGYGGSVYGGGSGGGADPPNGGPSGGGGGGGWVLGGRGGGWGPTGYGGNFTATAGGAVTVGGNIRAFSFTKAAGSVNLTGRTGVSVVGNIATDSGTGAGNVSLSTTGAGAIVSVTGYIDATSGGPLKGGDVTIDTSMLRVSGMTGAGTSIDVSGAAGVHGRISIRTTGLDAVPAAFDLVSTVASVPVLRGAVFSVGNAAVNGTVGQLVAGSVVAGVANAARVTGLLPLSLSGGAIAITPAQPAVTIRQGAGTVTILADNGAGIRTLVTPAQAIAAYQVLVAGAASGQTLGLNALGQAADINPQTGNTASLITLQARDLPVFTSFNLSSSGGQGVELNIAGAGAYLNLGSCPAVTVGGTITFLAAGSTAVLDLGSRGLTLPASGRIVGPDGGTLVIFSTASSPWTINGQVSAADAIFFTTQDGGTLTVNLGATGVLSGPAAGGGSLRMAAANVVVAGGQLRDTVFGTWAPGAHVGTLTFSTTVGSGASIGTIAGDTVDLAISGDWSLTGTMDVSASTLTVRPTGHLTVAGSITAPTLTIAPGSGLSLLPGALIQAANSVTFGGSSTLTIEGTISAPTLDFSQAPSVSIVGGGLLTAVSTLTLNPRGDLTLGVNLVAPSLSLTPAGRLVLMTGHEFRATAGNLVVSAGAGGVGVGDNVQLAASVQLLLTVSGPVEIGAGVIINAQRGALVNAGGQFGVGQGAALTSTLGAWSIISQRGILLSVGTHLTGQTGVGLRSYDGDIVVGDNSVVGAAAGALAFVSYGGGLSVGAGSSLSGDQLLTSTTGNIVLGGAAGGVTGHFVQSLTLITRGAFSVAGSGTVLVSATGSLWVTAAGGLTVADGVTLSAPGRVSLATYGGDLTAGSGFLAVGTQSLYVRADLGKVTLGAASSLTSPATVYFKIGSDLILGAPAAAGVQVTSGGNMMIFAPGKIQDLGLGSRFVVNSGSLSLSSAGSMEYGAGAHLTADRGVSLTSTNSRITIGRESVVSAAQGQLAITANRGQVAIGFGSTLSAGTVAPIPADPARLQVTRAGALTIVGGMSASGLSGVLIGSGLAPVDRTVLTSSGDRLLLRSLSGSPVALGDGASLHAVGGNVQVLSSGTVTGGSGVDFTADVAYRLDLRNYFGGGIEVKSGASTSSALAANTALAANPAIFSVDLPVGVEIGSVSVVHVSGSQGGIVQVNTAGGGTINLSAAGAASNIEVTGSLSYGSAYGSVFLNSVGAAGSLTLNGATFSAGQPVSYNADGEADPEPESDGVDEVLTPIAYLSGAPATAAGIAPSALRSVHFVLAHEEAEFTMSAAGDCLNLRAGSLFVRAVGALVVRTEIGEVRLSRSSLAVVETHGRYLCVRSLAGAVSVSAEGRGTRVATGSEVVIVRKVDGAEGVVLKDGIGRRNTRCLYADERVSFYHAEFSIPSLLAGAAYLKPLVRGDSVRHRQVRAEILKTAAALHVVTMGRGGFRAGLSTP